VALLPQAEMIRGWGEIQTFPSRCIERQRSLWISEEFEACVLPRMTWHVHLWYSARHKRTNLRTNYLPTSEMCPGAEITNDARRHLETLLYLV